MFENEIVLYGYEYTEDVQGMFELIKKCSDEIAMHRIFGDSDEDLKDRLEEVAKLKDYLYVTHGIPENQINRVLDSLDIRAEATLVIAEINSKISSIKEDIIKAVKNATAVMEFGDNDIVMVKGYCGTDIIDYYIIKPDKDSSLSDEYKHISDDFVAEGADRIATEMVRCHYYKVAEISISVERDNNSYEFEVSIAIIRR